MKEENKTAHKQKRIHHQQLSTKPYFIYSSHSWFLFLKQREKEEKDIQRKLEITEITAWARSFLLLWGISLLMLPSSLYNKRIIAFLFIFSSSSEKKRKSVCVLFAVVLVLFLPIFLFCFAVTKWQTHGTESQQHLRFFSALPPFFCLFCRLILVLFIYQFNTQGKERKTRFIENEQVRCKCIYYTLKAARRISKRIVNW